MSRSETDQHSETTGEVTIDAQTGDLLLQQPTPAPFIKWAGGKRAIVPLLEPYFPEKIGHYWEPFLGGGAVFFAMHERIEHATLSDINEELIITYNTVKSQIDALLLRLRVHASEHAEPSYYNHVRNQNPRTDVNIAARFIYLNKTCFNGLYRVNKQGKFNVPKGDYKNPAICNEQKLRAANAALQNVDFRVGDFTKTVKARSGDFIYCDPPYDGCFNNYQPGGFDDTAQERLKRAADRWAKAGASVVISNALTKKIQRLYAAERFKMDTIQAPRLISANSDMRGHIDEVVISTNV
jgi:DNA adenine methylase